MARQVTTTLVARDLTSPRPTRLLRRGEYNLPTGDPLEPVYERSLLRERGGELARLLA